MLCALSEIYGLERQYPGEKVMKHDFLGVVFVSASSLPVPVVGFVDVVALDSPPRHLRTRGHEHFFNQTGLSATPLDIDSDGSKANQRGIMIRVAHAVVEAEPETEQPLAGREGSCHGASLVVVSFFLGRLCMLQPTAETDRDGAGAVAAAYHV